MITTRAREGGPKEHSAKQNWPRETRSVTYVPGLSTFSELPRIVAQPPPSFLCCLRPPSHRPSSLTSVSLVPVPHWVRPSTPFWPYGTHSFFPLCQKKRHDRGRSTLTWGFLHTEPIVSEEKWMLRVYRGHTQVEHHMIRTSGTLSAVIMVKCLATLPVSCIKSIFHKSFVITICHEFFQAIRMVIYVKSDYTHASHSTFTS